MAMIAGTGFPGLSTPPPPEAPPPTAAAPVPDVPQVRAGSHFDAKQLRSRIQQLLAGMERADDQLRLLCETARDRKIFLMLEGPSGAYFRDWTEFVSAPLPWGLGMRPDLIEQLVKEHRDPTRRARLVLEAPLQLRYRGGQLGHASTRGPAAPAPDAARKGSRSKRAINGTDYLLQRLKRDFPELLQQVADGTLPSIRVAAEQAGIHRRLLSVLDTPMAFARAIVCHFDPAGQREIVDLVTHPERITAPPGKHSTAWKAYREATTPPDELARERAAEREAVAAGRRERNAAKERDRRAQAHALGLPSLAMGVEAAG